MDAGDSLAGNGGRVGPIAFVPPPGWKPTAIEGPDLGRASEVSIDSWGAWAPSLGDGRAVSACLGLDVSTWTEEATPIALERLTGTASGVAVRLTSFENLYVEHQEQRADVASQTLVSHDGAVSLRTFLGFTAHDSPRLSGCFVLCAPTTPACDAALAAATPVGPFVPPPRPTVALQALVLAVHHPRDVAAGAVALFVAIGVAAIWMRPRPRTK